MNIENQFNKRKKNEMSYRSGYGGMPSKNSNSKGYSMNAVPPPSSLANSARGFGRFQKGNNLSSSTSSSTSNADSGPASSVNHSGLSKHGYSTMDSIAQFASSSQYALGKRKAKTEDE